VVVAFAYYLVLARRLWFFADEWEFLAHRGAGMHDLMRAHYGHWVALPLLVYRALWWVVGLRSYLPYAGLAIALHCTAASLLWVVMRRAQVRAWTATIVASAFVLFGAGAQDILWAFQIAFGGALVLGLVHLLLADHDGPLDRRDWFGIAAGFLALLCSGVAVTMVGVVGIATLLRRGRRVAVVHTVPLAIVYGLWWAIAARGDYSSTGTVREVLDWIGAGLSRLFGALGSVTGLGWLVAAVLVAGGVLALRQRGAVSLRRELAVPVGLLAGVVAFVAIAAIDRSGFGSNAARAGRYLHVTAALLLPALAVAIDALWTRWRVAGAVAFAVLLIGVPGNVGDARDYANRQRLIDDATRRIMLTVPRAPEAEAAPDELRPEPNRAPTVTLGWLRAGVASGRIPRGADPTAREAATNRLRLSVMELDERAERTCPALRAPVDLELDEGQRIGIGGRVVVVLRDGRRAVSNPVGFGLGMLNPSLAHTLVATAPVSIRVAPGLPVGPLGATLCEPA
jgi:hypothetical protein